MPNWSDAVSGSRRTDEVVQREAAHGVLQLHHVRVVIVPAHAVDSAEQQLQVILRHLV